MAGTILSVTAAGAAQDDIDWFPRDYAALNAVLEASAMGEDQPVFAITVDPDAFEETIDEGYAAFLAFVRRAIIPGASDSAREAFARIEYFRDQTMILPHQGDEEKRTASYRSEQVAYVVDCKARTVAKNGWTRFARNNTDGRAIHFEQGAAKAAELEADRPQAGTLEDSVLRAVCEDEFLYSPPQ